MWDWLKQYDSTEELQEAYDEAVEAQEQEEAAQQPPPDTTDAQSALTLGTKTPEQIASEAEAMRNAGASEELIAATLGQAAYEAAGGAPATPTAAPSETAAAPKEQTDTQSLLTTQAKTPEQINREIIDMIEAGATAELIAGTVGQSVYSDWVKTATARNQAVEVIGKYKGGGEDTIDVIAALEDGIDPAIIDMALGEGVAQEYQEYIAARDDYEAAANILKKYEVDPDTGEVDLAAAIRGGVTAAIIDTVYEPGTAERVLKYVMAENALEPYKDETGDYTLYKAIDAGIPPAVIDAYIGKDGAYNEMLIQREEMRSNYIQDPDTNKWYPREAIAKNYGETGLLIAPGAINWDRVREDEAKLRASTLLNYMSAEDAGSQLYETGNKYEKRIGAILLGVPESMLDTEVPGPLSAYIVPEDPLTKWKKVTGDYYLELTEDEIHQLPDINERLRAVTIRNAHENTVRELNIVDNKLGTGPEISEGVTEGDVSAYKIYPGHRGEQLKEEWLNEHFTPEQIRVIKHEAPRRTYSGEIDDNVVGRFTGPSWMRPVVDTLKEVATLGHAETRTYNEDDLARKYEQQKQLIAATMEGNPERVTELYQQGAFGGLKGESYDAYIKTYNDVVNTNRLEDAVIRGDIVTINELKNAGYFDDNPELYDNYVGYVQQTAPGERSLQPLTPEEIETAQLDALGTEDQYIQEIMDKQPTLQEIAREGAISMTPIVGTARTWGDMSGGWRVASILGDIATIVPFIGGMAAAARMSVLSGKTARLAAATRSIPGLVYQEIKAPLTMVRHPIKTAKWAGQELGGLAGTAVLPRVIPRSTTEQQYHTLRLMLADVESPKDAMRIRDILMNKVKRGDLTADGWAQHIEKGRVYKIRPSALKQEVGPGMVHTSPDARKFIEEGVTVEKDLYLAGETHGRFLAATSGGHKPGAKLPMTKHAKDLDKQLTAALKSGDMNTAVKVAEKLDEEMNIIKQGEIAKLEREWTEAQAVGNTARMDEIATAINELEYRPMPGSILLTESIEVPGATRGSGKTYRRAAEGELVAVEGVITKPAAGRYRVMGADPFTVGIEGQQLGPLGVAKMKAIGPYEQIRAIVEAPLQVRMHIPSRLKKYFKGIKLGEVGTQEEINAWLLAAQKAEAAGDVAAAERMINQAAGIPLYARTGSRTFRSARQRMREAQRLTETVRRTGTTAGLVSYARAGIPKDTDITRAITPARERAAVAGRARVRVPGREPVGRAPTRRAPEVRAPKPRVTEPRATEPRAPGPRVTEPRATEPRAPGPRVPEPRTPEPRVPEPRTPEPRTPEPRVPEPRTPEPRTPEPRVPEPRIRTVRPPTFRAFRKSARDIKDLTQAEREGISAWRQGLWYKIVAPQTGEIWHLTEEEKPEWVPLIEGDDSAYATYRVKGAPIPPYKVPMGAQIVTITSGGISFKPTKKG